MPGCGYICPACNDNKILDNGDVCQWCVKESEIKKTISDEEWINTVHQGPCCSDIGIEEEE